MSPRNVRKVVLACAVLALAQVEPVAAIDIFWKGPDGGDWNTAANWQAIYPGPQTVMMVPRGSGGFNQRAAIGTDNPNYALAGSAVLSTLLPTNNQTIHGLALGLRERDPDTLAFINPAPAAGAMTGSLTISGGTTVLNNVSGAHVAIGADGRILVGVEGRGYLTMTGGSLTGTGLIVAGENISTGNGTSLVDLRGSSAMTINGSAQFSRRVRVEGPSVNFNATGQLRLDSSNTLTAAITSATAHSPLKTNNNAIVSGGVSVEFSGAAATRDPIATLGQTWDLIDSSLSENAIAGNFTNLGPSGDVQVSGLAPGSVAPLGAAYRVKTVGAAGHTKLQLVYDRVLILTVNRDTGQMSIRNPYGGNIAIDGYSVSSPLGSLLTSYTGIGAATPGAGTWVKPTDGVGQPLNSANVLTELQQPDFTPPISNTPFNLTGVPTVSLGTGFSKTAVASNVFNFGTDGEDLVFEYTGPGIGNVRGHIEYVGTKFENNLVLRVNPNTGQAFLKNDSLETVTFDGYSILSSTGALNGTGFTGLGGTWQSSPATPNALTQTNLTGATTLAPNAQLAIGDISALGFTTAAARDGLSMEFILSDNLAGDYNGNGTADASDYVLWRNGSALQDEGITTGANTPEDYTVWRAFFGRGVETNFRIGSVVFDATAGAGSGASLAAVPEPDAGWLLLIGLGGLFFAHGNVARLRRPAVPATVTARTSGQVGGRIMSRRFKCCLAAVIGLVAVTAGALPAVAQTHGFTLANSDFELPGPVGVKTVAFDDMGMPVAGIIPGWTFSGPGVEPFGDEVPGDSGTEGGGNPGNDLLLSTLDGVVYQTATGFNIHSITTNQQYKFSFDAHDIFTINDDGTVGYTNQGRAELTARFYYGAARTTLTTLVVHPPSAYTHYELIIPSNSPLLVPAAIGQPLGVEFDTTSIEFNTGTMFDVQHSWVGVDNVVLEVAPVKPGDLNGDGVLSNSDYVILRDNLQEAHAFEAAGELTGDNFVDLDDFRVFKSLLAGGGAGSGALAGAGVPEPASLVMVLIAAVGASFAAGRKRIGRSRRMHGMLVAAIGGCAALVAVSPAAAEQLYYDPFLIGPTPAAGQYSVGFVDPTLAPNDGQNPTVGPTPFFTGAWDIRESDGNAPNQQVIAEGLSFIGSPAAGGAVQTVVDEMTGDGNGRVGRYLSDPWTSTTEGTFYLSFLASFGTAGNPDATGSEGQADLGFRTVEFWPEGGTVGNDTGRSEIGYNGFFSALGEAQRVPATANLAFITPGGGTQLLTSTTFNQDNGATHLIVMKFVLSATAASDTVSVFLDPTNTIEPIVASATATSVDFTLAAMSAVSRFGTSGGILPIFDELRVGTTFVDVLPDFPLPGDTNGDDLVNMADYLNILRAMNLTGADVPNLPTNHPDVTGDGRVSIADYRLWKDNRTDDGAGAVLPAGVPEPASLLLALGGALVAVGWPRRRHGEYSN